MKGLKKCTYLILTIGMGLLYLNFVDEWQVYAESMEKFRGMYQDAVYGQEWQQAFPGGVLAQGSPNQGNSSQVNADQGNSDHANSGQGNGGKEMADGEGPQGEAANTDGGSGTDNGSNIGMAEGAVSGENQTGSPATGDPGADGENEADVNDGFGDGSDPVYMTVEDDYFSDAVFIGDSRTVGLYEYGGLEEITTFYASTGLTVYKIFDAEIVEVPGQRKKQTIEDALQQNDFKKIYLMIGINEMGTGTVESFTARYKEVVDHLLELQPDAILYIQGILKVSTERSNQGDYINNEGIAARNEALVQLADNRRIYYLDVNPLVCDETGGLEPSYTSDGVHLKAKYIEIWKDYLKSHAIRLNHKAGEQFALDDRFI